MWSCVVGLKDHPAQVKYSLKIFNCNIFSWFFFSGVCILQPSPVSTSRSADFMAVEDDDALSVHSDFSEFSEMVGIR